MTFKLNKKQLAKSFKRETGNVIKMVEELDQEGIRNLKKELEEKKSFKIGEHTLSAEMFLDWKEISKTYQEEKFTPNVIEPSFGIGRIIYCLLE